MRNHEGDVEAIVEEKDATPEQREIDEISSGILAFDAEFLVSALPRITNDNAKGEYYLTDAVGLAREDGLTVGAHLIDDVAQTEGANDRAQLAELGRELNRRIVTRWMKDGVTVMDPATTWIEADVVHRARRHDPPRHAAARRDRRARGRRGRARHDAEGLRDRRRRARRTHPRRARRHRRPAPPSGRSPTSGPAPSSASSGKIGTFVETKNSTIGDGAKVPHLSYVGDAEIGEGTNIGAGTIFANYDGVAKHRTVIGRHAKTGSNNTFVAPVDDRGRRGHRRRHRRTPQRAGRRAGGQQRRRSATSRAGRSRSGPARRRPRPRERRVNSRRRPDQGDPGVGDGRDRG